MYKKVREESPDEKSSSDDNPQDGDSCVDFNDQLRRKQQETSGNDLTKLERRKRKLNTDYSHEAAQIVAKNLLYGSNVIDALSTVKTWLEKGECTKHTAGNFYSLIQGVRAHVNSLPQKVRDYKDKIGKNKSDLIQYSQYSLELLDTIKIIFNLAHQQQVQTCFTETERNDIKNSKEIVEECREKLHQELNFRDNGNISEDNSTYISNLEDQASSISEHRELQKERKKLIGTKNRCFSQLSAIQEEKNRLTSQLAACGEECKRLKRTTWCTNVNDPNLGIQKQAQLIAIVSPFLSGHGDLGQSRAAISSHLKHSGFHISEKEVEDILTRYPSVFQKHVSKKGTTEEERWIFCGHQH